MKLVCLLPQALAPEFPLKSFNVYKYIYIYALFISCVIDIHNKAPFSSPSPIFYLNFIYYSYIFSWKWVKLFLWYNLNKLSFCISNPLSNWSNHILMDKSVCAHHSLLLSQTNILLYNNVSPIIPILWNFVFIICWGSPHPSFPNPPFLDATV